MEVIDLRNGNWTSIPNPVLESLLQNRRIQVKERVYLALIRLILGYEKKRAKGYDRISYSQIADLIGATRRMVIYCCQQLEAEHRIEMTANGRYKPNTFTLELDISNWVSEKLSSPELVKDTVHHTSEELVSLEVVKDGFHPPKKERSIKKRKKEDLGGLENTTLRPMPAREKELDEDIAWIDNEPLPTKQADGFDEYSLEEELEERYIPF